MGKLIEALISGLTSLLLVVRIGGSKGVPENAGEGGQKELQEIAVELPLERLETIKVGRERYRFASFFVAEPSRLHLFPNFLDKRAAQNLKEVKQCEALVNGGFYSEDFKPLGWLVTESRQVSAPLQSRLLDGFFSVDQAGKAKIDWQKPAYPVRIGLQSGPMLLWQGQPLQLQIKDDQQRRRIVLAITGDQAIVFLAITGETSEGSGPYLADLPQIVAGISDQLQMPFTTAVNLDGGSASAFLTDEVQLDEVTFIGSYFCLQ